MDDLARRIARGEDVLFVVGAGVSVNSGIPCYRRELGSIWNTFVEEWATVRKFREDPKKWYNEFWLKSHNKSEFLDAVPNAAHFALSCCVNLGGGKLITQNIDNLHRKANIDAKMLIEVHGRLSSYRCSNYRCEFSYRGSIDDIDMNNYLVNEDEYDPPLCSMCYHPLLPMALLFDEYYESNEFFQVRKAREWMNKASAVVFIGTSFSVGITEEALMYGSSGNKPMFSFNLREEKVESAYDIRTCAGPCEENLPRLVERVLSFLPEDESIRWKESDVYQTLVRLNKEKI